jgi:uncharacterized protein with PIN domain
MKKEIEVCDNCKKSLAKTQCDFCKNDLCNRCSRKTRLTIGTKNYSVLADLNFCSKCDKKMIWDGELSDDIKEIILNQIKARIMLNTIEE